MAQFFGKETINKFTRTSGTVLTWPAGSRLKIGGKAYNVDSNLTCTVSVSGAGGLDTGAIAADSLYYLYAVYSTNTVSLVASLSRVSPTGFTVYRQLGSFVMTTTSNIESIENNVDGLAEKIQPGHVQIFASDLIPEGVMVCDGRSLLRSAFPDLFAAIGTRHGSASGTTFNIPDYRGRFLRMVDGGAGRDPDVSIRVAANSGGIIGDNVGSVQGQAFQTHTHVQNSHTHNIPDTGGTMSNGALGTKIWRGLTTTQEGGAYANTTTTAVNQNAVASGTHSQATSNETRPVNANVLKVIKY